jgi:hypothetical protein
VITGSELIRRPGLGSRTDSYRDGPDPFTSGLRLVPYSNGVPDDFPGQTRRTGYRARVAQRMLPGGGHTGEPVPTRLA